MAQLVTSPPIKGTPTTVRDTVLTDDSSNPAVGTGVDLSNYTYAEVEIIIGGTDPVWNVTPLLVNGAGDTYMEGETITLSGTGTYVREIQIIGNSDINFRVDGSTGTSPTITVKVIGFNK